MLTLLFLFFQRKLLQLFIMKRAYTPFCELSTVVQKKATREVTEIIARSWVFILCLPSLFFGSLLRVWIECTVLPMQRKKVQRACGCPLFIAVEVFARRTNRLRSILGRIEAFMGSHTSPYISLLSSRNGHGSSIRQADF